MVQVNTTVQPVRAVKDALTSYYSLFLMMTLTVSPLTCPYHLFFPCTRSVKVSELRQRPLTLRPFLRTHTDKDISGSTLQETAFT